jgi:hypothetical protein
MTTEKSQGSVQQDLKEYKTIEARFYGDLMKICRRYGSDLSIISVLGIMEIVKSELKELDKQGRQLMKQEQLDLESGNIDTIL